MRRDCAMNSRSDLYISVFNKFLSMERFVLDFEESEGILFLENNKLNSDFLDLIITVINSYKYGFFNLESDLYSSGYIYKVDEANNKIVDFDLSFSISSFYNFNFKCRGDNFSFKNTLFNDFYVSNILRIDNASNFIDYLLISKMNKQISNDQEFFRIYNNYNSVFKYFFNFDDKKLKEEVYGSGLIKELSIFDNNKFENLFSFNSAIKKINFGFRLLPVGVKVVDKKKLDLIIKFLVYYLYLSKDIDIIIINEKDFYFENEEEKKNVYERLKKISGFFKFKFVILQ